MAVVAALGEAALLLGVCVLGLVWAWLESGTAGKDGIRHYCNSKFAVEGHRSNSARRDGNMVH